MKKKTRLPGRTTGVYEDSFIHPSIADVVGLIFKLAVIGLDLLIYLFFTVSKGWHFVCSCPESMIL